jgi:BirA family biotin operon repressor/biotin-[acetyl-CoA-carboxylase] ligase
MHAPTLSTLPFIERFESHPVIGSTSDRARSLTDFPQSGIFVIQADRQNAGRGRSGAPYFSGEGGLWATIVARLPSIEEHFRHNRALSLAITGACEAAMAAVGADREVSVKWPNDLYLSGRKLCGILLENHPACATILILGFGLNVNIPMADFPESLAPLVTSLAVETGAIFSRSRLLEEIIGHYHANLAIDDGALHKEYCRRLYRQGERAEVEGETGILDGVETDGRLRLLTGHGVRYFVSGHVRFTGAHKEAFHA